MTQPPHSSPRPGTLRLELDVPELEPVASLFTAWGFRCLVELQEPERCALFTDGFFKWAVTERLGPAQICLHYLTGDWTGWLSTTAPSIQETAQQAADPEWGICFEVSDRVHVQIQPADSDLEPPALGVSLLSDGRFAEVGIGTARLAEDLGRWGQLGFGVVHRSPADEPPHALLFDGLLLVGLYEQASWTGPSLAFFAEEPAAHANEARQLGLPVEELQDQAWRVWLPGELSLLWLPEYRNAGDEN